jgi:hypothetical protein
MTPSHLRNLLRLPEVKSNLLLLLLKRVELTVLLLLKDFV